MGELAKSGLFIESRQQQAVMEAMLLHWKDSPCFR